MANPFAVNGAAPEKSSKYAPLLVNRFWSGQWSNSNPLSEAPTQFLIQKFYAGARYDTIRYGQNVEVSPRLTLIRRAGSSVFNNQDFAAINTFESFRVFNSQTQQTQIRVVCDTGSAVYDCTGPSTKTLLFTKLANAGQTSFLSIGNTLYAGDGVSAWKWIWTPGWMANTSYTTGTVITDTNGNLQVLTAVPVTFPIPPNHLSVSVLNNVVSITWSNQALFAANQLASLPGTSISFSGFVGASFLNGLSLPAQSAFNVRLISPSIESATLTFNLTNANYGPANDDTGSVVYTAGTAVSSGSTPSWSTTVGGTTTDGPLIWTNKGPAVQNWGIYGPTGAPIVSNTLVAAGTAWVASSYYWPFPVIVDSNSNLQLLTTDGTTSTVPVWATTPGVTTTDGTAVWTCIGPAARSATTAYAAGTYIGVSVTTTYQTVIGVDSHTHQPIYETISITSFYLFQCTVAGTTSATATASLNWPSTLGGSITDGSVSWVNAGYQVTRVNSASLSPTGTAKGNVANSTVVTKVASIVDNASSGGGSGFTQNVVLAGLSGSSAPTWKTTGSPAVEQAGLLTSEASGLQWRNAGPVGAANTGSWIYGYAFLNSVSGEISSMSPASSAITLAAQSVISISGNGDPNWATDGVDKIIIYRSVQGFSTPFQLIIIPAPAGGAPWSYVDASPDPPNPGAILNEFISADTIGNNAPPPAGLTNLTYYLNRVLGSAGEFQYWSGVATQPVGVGASSWAGLNYFQMPEMVTRSWPSATGLLIFTVRGTYYSQGIDLNFNPNVPIRLLEDIGLLSTNLFTINGSIPVLLTSDQQMLALDPSAGISRYSDPIADPTFGMGGFSTISSYLTWHASGIDSAYYLADGSTGWFRLSPTSAPESGFTWSPKANIVNGARCIQSIETSPGVKQLLIHSGAGGHILYRDLTINADAGTAYTAFAVLGSLVFAQPQQCAEIDSISTFTTAVGSKIQVSVLGNEISPSVNVPFEILQTSVPEPPFLNSPVSLYNDRWYFADLQQPGWLQHMQIRFDWPAENYANELLAFSVYGCVHTVG